MRLIDDENLDNVYCFFLALERFKCLNPTVLQGQEYEIISDFCYLVNKGKMDLHYPDFNLFSFIKSDVFRSELVDFLEIGFDNWFDTNSFNEVLHRMKSKRL